MEMARDRLIDRVHLQRHVGRRHHRRVLLGRIVRIHDHVLFLAVDRLPLMRARGAFHQLPVIFEQHLEIAHVPCRRVRLPRALDPGRDRVAALAAAMGADPAQTHLVHRGRFRLRADKRRVTRAMRLAEGVPTGHQRHGLIVIHRHPRKSLAHVLARGHRIGVAIRTFGVDVDQAHLHGGQRVFQLALAGVAHVTQPAVFLAPIDVLFRLPDVGTTAAKTKALEAHRLHRDVARQDVKVSPGDLVAVFLLDRPQQAARLVQVGIVRPAVGGRKTLRPGAAAPAPVSGAIGACAVPCHADEQTAVMAPIRRPPFLAVGHQRRQILLQRLEVQLLEFLGVVERLAHRIDLGGMLTQDLEVQRIRPPLAIRAALVRCVRVDRRMHDRAFADVISVHVSLRFLLVQRGVPQVARLCDKGMPARHMSLPPPGNWNCSNKTKPLV